MKNKKCEIFNYIPHKKPRYINYDIWFKHYEKDIINIYEIFLGIINTNYPEYKNIYETENNFKKFSKMIYNSSSKFIFKDY